MANSMAHDKMCTLWGEVAETTSMNMTLSKDLETYSIYQGNPAIKKRERVIK